MSHRKISRRVRAFDLAAKPITNYRLQMLENRTLLCAVPHVSAVPHMDDAAPLDPPAVNAGRGVSIDAPASIASFDTADSGLPLLNSNPDAFAQLLLDFDGRSEYAQSYSEGWDTNGDPTTFDAYEQSWIVDMWQRTAEKFSPFNI